MLNLREEPLSIVANLEQPAQDGNVAVDLIELTQAHKVSLKPQDEVDVGQLAVLSSLADKQDGAAPFDIDDGTVIELYRLRIPKSSSKNADLSPVIWFVALVSITHRWCSRCSPLSSICANTRSSLS